MTTREKALAVALRSAQWRLDDAAFKAGAGSLTSHECAELVADLHQLAALVAEYAGHALPKAPNIIVPGEAEGA